MNLEDAQRRLEQARADARAAGVVMGDAIKEVDGPAELEGVVMNEGLLTVDLAGLPPGSLVTITVRVGPEPAPPAEPEPPAQRRYMGQRINTP